MENFDDFNFGKRLRTLREERAGRKRSWGRCQGLTRTRSFAWRSGGSRHGSQP
jgi:hypothetical protein